jgi:hypothetical protein
MTTLIKLKFGSHLYGTDTPASDLDIKLGKLPYQEVATEIEGLLDEVVAAEETSNLPAEPDRYFIDGFIYNAYKEVIKNA